MPDFVSLNELDYIFYIKTGWQCDLLMFLHISAKYGFNIPPGSVLILLLNFYYTVAGLSIAGGLVDGLTDFCCHREKNQNLIKIHMRIL